MIFLGCVIQNQKIRCIVDTVLSSQKVVVSPLAVTFDWKNVVGDKRGNFKKHEQCKQHQDAQQQATEFLRVCDSKERKDVYSFLSTAYKEKIERNRKILLSIVDVIVTLERGTLVYVVAGIKLRKRRMGTFSFLSTGKSSLIKTSNTISKKEQGMHSIFPSRLRMSLLRVAKQK